MLYLTARSVAESTLRIGRCASISTEFALRVSDKANLSSSDHRQESSHERQKDHGINSLTDNKLLCPS
jgi:hypothetical protein